MAGSTTVTANKGRRRKLPARSEVRYGWRKREARIKALDEACECGSPQKHGGNPPSCGE